MAGLVPAIHVFLAYVRAAKTWMPGTRLGITKNGSNLAPLKIPKSDVGFEPGRSSFGGPQ
jgi:hypothetical protein